MGDLEQRFLSHVEKTEGCWVWKGSRHCKGYGQFNVGGKVKKAHRVGWALYKKEIPEGMQLDHLCRNRACVNPEHLEPVDNRNNVVRGKTFLDKKTDLPLGVNQVGKRFRAQKRVLGMSTHVGYFDTPEEAHKAYLRYGGKNATITS